MNKSLYILFCLSFVAGNRLVAQTTIDSVKVPSGSSITTDYLENLYVITPTNDIIKYSKRGIRLATANFKVLGNISSVDASNPFEIYVFYRDQNKLLLLDNQLNLRGECDLELTGSSQIASVARSADNQIWLFDMSDLKLKKYSKDLKLLMESAVLNTILPGQNINPVQITDINSSVLVLTNNTLLEFDIFANFSKTVLTDTFKNFQFFDQAIYFLKDSVLYKFDRMRFKLESLNITLPPNTRFVRIEKLMLYILSDEYVFLRASKD